MRSTDATVAHALVRAVFALMRTPAKVLLLALTLLFGLAASEPAPLVTSVDSIGLTVSDLDRSVDFYAKVLAFEKVSELEAEGSDYEHLQGVFGLHIRRARMRLGGEFIELTEYLAPRGRPAPSDQRSNDLWFQHIAIVVSDMDAAYRWLRSYKVRHASSSPQRLPDWNKNAAGIQAFYFRDPDGHPLEVIAFPPGKGDAKWRRLSDGKLFLGIDHTAITVSDTTASLKFYRDTLGLHVAGESDNYGVEQEHLNNVFGAHLRITSLRAATGPGVEFLEYVAPRDGRAYPSGEKPNDLVHWQTRMRSVDAVTAADRLLHTGRIWISSGVVKLNDREAGIRKSIIVRDPDGHAVEIVE
jgi:catechol 2,3-dioxygenase-like lactoylglutathione lyase family enzyme